MKSHNHKLVFPQAGRQINRSRTGFALVISLGLMAFIVLLILSLTTLTQVEMATAAHNRAQQQARENARFGLLVALGNLQAAAAKDQRVTARGENLSEAEMPAGYEYYTGVWDTTETNPEPVWLASGLNANQDYPMRLVGMGSTSDANKYVTVLGEAIEGEDGVDIGAYGYWVSDQSLKADVGVAGGYNMEWMTDWKDQVSAQSQTILRTGVESLFSENSDFDQEDNTIQKRLKRMLDIEDATHIHRDFLDVIQANFHDLAIENRSLFTNTVDGGLKTNLSVDSVIDSGSSDPFTNGSLKDYFDINRNIKNVTVQGEQFEALDGELLNAGYITEPGPGMAHTHFTPIITEAVAYIAVFNRKSGTINGEKTYEPAMRYYLDVELYNPYPFPILIDSTRAAGLELLFTNLPEIKITNQSAGRNTGWFKIDNISRSRGIGVGSWLTIDDNANAYDYGNRKTYLLPGEVYRLEDPDPAVKKDGIWMDLGGYDIGEVKESSIIKVEGRRPSNVDGFTIQLFQREPKYYVPNRENETQLLFEVTDIPYSEDFEYRFSPAVDNTNGPDYWQGDGTGGTFSVEDSYIMAFQFKIEGNWDDDSIEPFLNNFDLRQPRFSYNDTFKDNDGSSLAVSDYIKDAGNPVETEQDLNGVFSHQDLFSDETVRERNEEDYRSVRLYDVPTHDPMSVSAARYAYIVGENPKSIGGIRGDDLNEAFDKYFFSSVPRDINSWEVSDPLPNPRIIYEAKSGVAKANLRQGANATTTAQDFQLRGGFNINSLSRSAWQTLLSQDLTGTGYQWKYSDYEDEMVVKTLNNVFFTFPFNANHHALDPVTDAEASSGTGSGYLSLLKTHSDAQDRLFRQSFRALDSDNGEDQIRQLAYHITDISGDAQEQLGRPFLSVDEFVSYQHNTIAPDGIIQTAIDNVGPEVEDDENDVKIDAVDPINDGIPTFSPLYLKQEDIIGMLASVLTARGDTFLIRSGGMAFDPLSNDPDIPVSEAYLEAMVQREYGTSTSATASRPFKIISFRWLKPSDI